METKITEFILSFFEEEEATILVSWLDFNSSFSKFGKGSKSSMWNSSILL